MKEKIRTLSVDKFEEINRFLEKCYGHAWNFFPRNYPNLYRKEPEALDCCLVIEKAGKIVSHVGTFPIKIKLGESELVCGGIGGVSTLASERGQGYMSKLMNYSIELMEEKDWPLSVLWGDQQRYSHFDYETCGIKYNLIINQRSLKINKIKPVKIEEVDPLGEDVVVKVKEFYTGLNNRIKRPNFSLQLARKGVRVFLGSDGYLISQKEYGGDLEIQEIVSPNGKEAELILAALSWTKGSKANVHLGLDSGERLQNLLKVASSWKIVPQGMFKIINFYSLLKKLQGFFATKVINIEPFSLTLGCKSLNKTTMATIKWDGKDLKILEGKQSANYIEVDSRQLIALLLGGPHSNYKKLGLLSHLLPLPINLSVLDHV